MKKQILNIAYLLVTIIVLFFASCSKDKPCVQTTTIDEIPLKDRNVVIPYNTGFEWLHFYSKKNEDTLIYKVTGWYTDFGEIQTEPECNHVHKLQRWFATYNDSLNSKSIIVKLLFYDLGGAYIEIDYDKNTYIGEPWPYNTDSITIQNKIYYNIQSFSNDYKPENQSKYLCYYNRKFGVLKLETSTNDTLELLYVD